MVVVCGEALVDVIRMPDGTERLTPGGGPFNTARALGRLGVPVAFLGRLSDDRFGRELAAALFADGVSLALTSVGPEPTTRAVAEVDGSGIAEYRFKAEGTSAPNLTREMVPVQLAHEVTAIHVGSLGMVFEPIASTLAELVPRERKGRLVMLDPNIRAAAAGAGEHRERLIALMAQSTIVKASPSDLAWLFPNRNHVEVADDLVERGVPLAVVTLGADGAYARHRGLRVQVAAPAVALADTIGAGDVFGAGLLAWLHDHDLLLAELALDESRLRAALAYACLAASLTCARVGADPPHQAEMLEAGRRFGILPR